MRAAFPPRLQKHRQSGVVRVRIFTPRGAQWVSTGQTSYKAARQVCDQAMIERLQQAACAEALTADVISRLLTGRRFTCADILDGWEKESVCDLAPDTFAAYGSLLRQWMADSECGNKPLSSIPLRALKGWVNTGGVPAGTRRARLAALRSYYKYSSASGFCVGNLAELVSVQTRDLMFTELEPQSTVPMTEAEYRILMNSPRLTGFFRHATALAWWLGFRLRDVACFQLDSLRDSVCTIYQRKTGQRLELPLDDPLLGGGELNGILLEIIEQTPAGSKFCFPDKREIAVNPKRRASLSVAYQRILQRHGIDGKRFHSLRHAFAMRLKNAGLTIEQIAERMGHASTASTMIYTDHG